VFDYLSDIYRIPVVRKIVLHLLFGLTLLCCSGLYGQVITYTFSEEIYVCEATRVLIEIKNTTSASTSAGNLRLKLPCKSRYVANSISNANEVNISNLSEPLFKLNLINIGESLSLEFDILLDCQSMACLTEQKLFQIESIYTYDGKTIAETSLPFNVSSPNLTFTKIVQPYIEIESGTKATRVVTFKNSKKGRLSSCLFADNFDDILKITSTHPAVVAVTPSSLTMKFDSSDFVLIGNKDKYLDFDEEITFEEVISFKDCSLDEGKGLSSLTVSWGCNNSSCQSSQAFATARLKPIKDIGSKLFVNAVPNDVKCLDPGRADQILEIKEITHKHVLQNVRLTIEHVDGLYINIATFKAPENAKVTFDSVSVNDCGDSIAKRVFLLIEEFTPYGGTQRSTFIKWQAVFCSEFIPECDFSKTRWKYALSYVKACASNSDYAHSVKAIAPPLPGAIINAGVLVIIPNKPPAVDGDIITIQTFLGGALLKSEQKSVDVKLVFPDFLVVQPTDFKMRNKLPTNVVTTQANNRTTLVLTYMLPFDTTGFYMDIPVKVMCPTIADTEIPITYTSCFRCDGIADNIYGVRIEALMDFGVPCSERGRIKGCGAISFKAKCNNLILIPKDTLSGYYDFKMDFGRITPGKPDLDENGFPDGNSQLPYVGSKTEYVWGDTMLFRTNGAIKVDIPGTTYNDMVIELDCIDPSSSSQESRDFLIDLLFQKNGWKSLKSKLVIKDKSQNKRYEILDFVDTMSTLKLVFDLRGEKIRQKNSQIPLDFKYEQGDSIFFETFLTFDKEVYKAYADKHDYSQNLKFIVKVSTHLGDTLTAFNNVSDMCDCQNGNVHLAGYIQRYTPATYNVFNEEDICSGAKFTAFLFKVNVGHTLVSPLEVREAARLKKIKFGATPHFLLQKMNIKYRNNFYPFLPSSVDQTGTTYELGDVLPWGHPSNGSSLSDLAIDLTKVLVDDCVSRIENDAIPYTLYFETNEISGLIIKDSLQGTIFSEYKLPTITQEVAQNKITAFNTSFSTSLKYLEKTGFSFDIKNLFVRVRSSENITSIRVYDPISGNALTNQNNIYQIGDLKKGKFRNLVIDGKAASCGREVIYLDFGYDCGMLTDPARTPCHVQTDSIEIFFPTSIIDMDIDEKPVDADLCTEIEQKLLVYNAGLGAAFDINVDAELPIGMSIVEGSSKLEYPVHSGTLINMQNPVLISGTTYRWKVKNSWPLHNIQGLNGTNFAPENRFNLIYKVKTSCDYIVGKSIIYRAIATQLCGTETNIPVKVSNNIKISNVTPPYSIVIKADTKVIADCELDTLRVDLSFKKPEGTVPFQTNMELPSGYMLVSTSGNLQNNTAQFLNNTLIWLSTTSADSVRLQVVLTKKGIAFCEPEIFKVFTSVIGSASCLGQDCNVSVVTGEKILTIPPRSKNLQIENFEIDVTTNGDIIVRIGTLKDFEGSQIIKVSLFIDSNRDNIYSTGDNTIDTFVLSLTQPNQSFTLTTSSMGIKAIDLCRAMIHVDGAQNCICGDILKSAKINGRVINEPVNLCSLDSLAIGVNMNIPGAVYQWNKSEGLSCTQCPMAFFNLENTSVNPIVFEKILTITTIDGCKIDYVFDITVNPTPSIINQDATICAGDTTNIIATLADSYEWSGPNILENGKQILRATPSENSRYTVIITDANGCTGEGFVDVKVSAAPSASVMFDSIACRGLSPKISIDLGDDVTFEWIQGGQFLDDRFSLMPSVITEESVILKLRIKKEDCYDLIDIPITIKPGFVIEGIRDTSQVCKGEPLQFKLTGAISYEITPAALVICNNPNCSDITINTDFDEQSFIITAVDTSGCISTKFINIKTSSLGNIKETSATICQGDSIKFNGVYYKAEGTYCDTVTLAAGCKEIVCLKLLYTPIVVTATTVSICEGDSIKVNDVYVKQPGRYCDTIQLATGCLESRCIDLVFSTIIKSTSDIAICSGDTLKLMNSNITVAGSYCDTIQLSTGCLAINCTNVTVKPPNEINEPIAICADSTFRFNGQVLSEPGKYCQVLKGNGNQCDTTKCIELTFLPLPNLDGLTLSYEVNEGDSTTLIGPPGFSAYSWSPAIGLSCTDCQSPIVTGTEDIEYTLTVTNLSGCTEVGRLKIIVGSSCLSKISKIPNAFTPNGDRINDVYTIPDIATCGPIDIVVYNRWGNIVFEKEDWNNMWDGLSNNGKPLPQGTYYIALKFRGQKISSKTMVDLRLE
jgi:gliding motility-associated-like protein